MTIRTQLPWPMRFGVVALVGVASAMAMWSWDSGRVLPVGHSDNLREQLSDARELADKYKSERDQFSTTVNAAESQLNIERSAQKQLAAQVKTLEQENMALKEDLAFFESLLPTATGPQGINLRRMKLDLISPNQLRYRLLIMQGGNGAQTFVGNLQLAVSGLQNGRNAMINFPDTTPGEQDKFRLSFKYYQRVEGVLTLPEGVTAKSVQARVLDRGIVRAQQSANL